jgi:hypothetical protein
MEIRAHKNAKLIHYEDAIVWELIALSAAKPPKVFHPQSLINLHSYICTSVWVYLLMYESVIFKGFLRGACRGKYAIVRVCYKVCYIGITIEFQ